MVVLKLKHPLYRLDLEGLVNRLLSPASRVFGCRSGARPQICFSKKFPGDADVSGPEIEVQEPLA